MLNLNRGLVVADPTLAVAAFIGSCEVGMWAPGAAVLEGMLTVTVDTMEPGRAGGQ